MSSRMWMVVGAAALLIALAALAGLWWKAWAYHKVIRSLIAQVQAAPSLGSLRGDLPPLMAQFVARSGLQHPEQLKWLHMKQQGQMRLAPAGAWMPLRAEQYMAVSTPAFVWLANVRMTGGITAVVVDSLVNANGLLEARILGGVPVAYSEGPVTLKGELLRLLAELPWNPAAVAVNPAIQWHQLDAHRVQARAAVGGVTAVVEFRFDDVGDIVAATATDRPMGGESNAVPRPWRGDFSDYRVLNGVRIPTHAVVAWDLPEGWFEYWRGDIVAVTWK